MMLAALMEEGSTSGWSGGGGGRAEEEDEVLPLRVEMVERREAVVEVRFMGVGRVVRGVLDCGAGAIGRRVAAGRVPVSGDDVAEVFKWFWVVRVREVLEL
jgi:hypothetical protein